MEPHNSYNHAPELPQPEESTSGMPEHAAAPETNTQAPTLTPPVNDQPMVAIPPLPGAASSAVPTAAPVNPPATDTPLMADDADLIEKEWVTKAKAIVAQTKDNPYEQNKAMNQVKADYLKKRYNKDLKVGEA
jgi:hypothetical protein